jgi:two-component system, NarL family, sensor kinase
MTTQTRLLRSVTPKGAVPLLPMEVSTDGRRIRHFADPLPGLLDELVAGFCEQVAIVDENWMIVSVNGAWKQMIKVGGYPELVPGTDYKDFLETFALRGHENAATVLAGVMAIDGGETDSFEFVYAGVDQWEGRTLQLRLHRLSIAGNVVTTIARQDVTDSVEVDRVRRDCTAAILNSETEARQRLTRELHDSTAQVLTSIGLLLSTLKRKRAPLNYTDTVDDTLGLLDQATRQIRSMAYLAHAPDVCELGIARALESLASGFGRRAQLDISFEVHGTRTQLPPPLKTAVYRIAQEALSNAHRHAHAKHVKVGLVFRKAALHLVVADDGAGVPDEILAGKERAGVGISGMRLRLAEIGGRLSIRRLDHGTAIVATVPLA